MKHILIFLICLPGCVVSFSQETQFPYITDLSYSPQNVRDNDTVIIHYSYTFGMSPCTRDSISISPLNDTCLVLDVYYAIGDAASPCNGTDLVTLGMLSADKYSLIFNLYGFNSTFLEASDSDTLYLTVKGTGTVLNTGTINVPGIYPNPADGKIYFKGIQHAYYISISNFLGQQVLFRDMINGEQPLDVSDLKPGLYIVLIYNRTHQLIYNDKLCIR